MPRVGFEPTISAGERPKTYALDRAATGTGCVVSTANIKGHLPLIGISVDDKSLLCLGNPTDDFSFCGFSVSSIFCIFVRGHYFTAPIVYIPSCLLAYRIDRSHSTDRPLARQNSSWEVTNDIGHIK